MARTDDKKHISSIAEAQIKKDLERLSELTNSSNTLTRTENYIMAMTGAERQKALRERRKEESKRLELWVSKQSGEIFVLRAKDKGMTQSAYFDYLLGLDK